MSVPGPPFEGLSGEHVVDVANAAELDPNKWLRCRDCEYWAVWDADAREFVVMQPGNPNFAHGGSW
jgi:hypothetical protein